MRRRSKWTVSLVLVLAVNLLFGSLLYAFQDMPEGAAGQKLMSLKERGMIQGNGKVFHGERALKNSEAVQMLVNGMDLSLAAFLFIKEPLASDSFDRVPNDAWYSQAFVIAAVNGLELPRDIDPKADISREAFAHHLLTAMLLKGDYPFTKRLFTFKDAGELNPDYMHSIQLLMNAGILQVDADSEFHPKQAITRLDAAVMLYDALEFMIQHQQQIPEDGITVDEVTMTTEAISEDLNKLTLSWGEQPNAGYTITITKVVFVDDQTAEIYYRLGYPKKDEMYAQVITTPTAVTYVSSAYIPVLVQD